MEQPATHSAVSRSLSIWEGACEAFETSMLRRSAAVAVAHPCIPKAVVRLGRRTPLCDDQDDPRVSSHSGVRRPLVNDLGPAFEVILLRAPFPLLFTGFLHGTPTQR